MVGNTKPYANHFSESGDLLMKWLYGDRIDDRTRGSVNDVLDGISANLDPVDNPQGGDSKTADVQIFCTHNRLKKAKDDKGNERWYDPAINSFLKKANKWECANALAFVSEPDDEDRELPDLMQICPWFLDYGMKQKHQFATMWNEGITASMILALKLDKLATWVNYTPIDLFGLFDKVMVHEMSHTRRGGRTKDAEGFGSYGWKNCRRIANQRPSAANPNQALPHSNADTYGLFVSAGNLYFNGGIINEDGTFKEPVHAHNNKRRFNAIDLKGRPIFV